MLAILKGSRDAPGDLCARAGTFAGSLLELSGWAQEGAGKVQAAGVLEDSRAWSKFQQICEAQGGMRAPTTSRYRKLLVADSEGVVENIDNRRIARLAKLAGAPEEAAVIDLHVRLGDRIVRGTPLFTLHAEAEGELA